MEQRGGIRKVTQDQILNELIKQYPRWITIQEMSVLTNGSRGCTAIKLQRLYKHNILNRRKAINPLRTGRLLPNKEIEYQYNKEYMEGPECN